MKHTNIGLAKAVICEAFERENYLIFNGAAMYEFNGIWGNASNYFDKAGLKNAEQIKELMRGFEIMARQGELARERQGYKKRELISADEAAFSATPKDLLSVQQACMDAVNLGYGRELTDEDEEIDLGLLEIQKKRAKT